MIDYVPKMTSVLVGHTFWGRGGAEIAAMWLIHALHEHFKLSVVTRGGWDLDALNQIAGTNVPQYSVSLVTPPAHMNRLPGAFGVASYQRFCRRIARDYDVRITASRYLDWGEPAIHFLSDVTWNPELQQTFRSAEHQARQGMLRSPYWALATLLAGRSSRSPMTHDLFVANSRWTAQVSQEYCRHELITIQPPVLAASSPLPWAEREDGFVVLGRISPEKRIEDAIAVLRELRQRSGNDNIRLYIVGGVSDPAYADRIVALAQGSSWIQITGPLYGLEKEFFVRRQRYAISACDCEGFGMATAEMAALGLIPFVPDCGAQKEIVQSELLCYASADDAVNKIMRVMHSGAECQIVSSMLQRNAANCAPSVFCARVLDVVEQFAAHGPAWERGGRPSQSDAELA